MFMAERSRKNMIEIERVRQGEINKTDKETNKQNKCKNSG